MGARSLIHRDEGAQALVEFALVLPLFILIVTGLLDAARAVWQSNTLAYAAREGTRYAIVHGSGGDPQVGPCSMCVNSTDNNLDLVVNVVRNAAVGVRDITVTIDYPDLSHHRLDRVSVEATAQFVPLPSQYMLGGAFQITLRGGSQLVIQR